MFSMTKRRELDEMQTPFYFVNRRNYGEDIKILPKLIFFGIILHLDLNALENSE